MLNIPKVAQYARFSSDNQRSESIDAQIRAMNQFCKQNHWQVVSTYTDEARSATTDNRPQFQQMIADSSKGLFDIVLVHKLDRFSRDRYDSAIYKKKLKKNHVKLCSVLERMDDSPESIMMEAVLEGMSEYYSKNLAREVMKGMNETALQCKHTGGCPPLGYDLDENRHLVINEWEAQAVRIIFQMFADGYGYSEIIDRLNAHGYKTKRGKMFLIRTTPFHHPFQKEKRRLHMWFSRRPCQLKSDFFHSCKTQNGFFWNDISFPLFELSRSLPLFYHACVEKVSIAFFDKYRRFLNT